MSSGTAPYSYSAAETRLIGWAREIRRIDAALARIEARQYGYCLSCGRAISHARLEMDPAASQCEGCGPDPEASGSSANLNDAASRPKRS